MRVGVTENLLASLVGSPYLLGEVLMYLTISSVSFEFGWLDPRGVHSGCV